MRPRWPWLLILPLLLGVYLAATSAARRAPRAYTPQQLEALMQGVFIAARPAIVQLQSLNVDTEADKRNLLVTRGRATGFFISPDGYLLTAYHAVSGMTHFQVLTTRQELLPARVVGFDESRDLALLKATARGNVAFITPELARPMMVGEPLVEVGNSGEDFIQPRYGTVQSFETDAGMLVPTRLVISSLPLNPGDSGGAVLDRHGKVVAVGIGTARSTERSVSLLVPLEGQAALMTQLRGGANLRLPGVGLHVLHHEPSGVLIDRVEPDSSAAEAGIEGGVVTSLDGRSIEGQYDYYTLLRGKRIGDPIQLTVQDKGGSREFRLEVR